jgi:hypothetical protein
MAVTETRVLPAEYIEALGKTYADQLTKAVGTTGAVDVSKLYGQQFVAGPSALQTQAEQLAGGLGSYAPYLQAAQAATRAYGLSSLHVSLSTRCDWNDITRI